MSEYTDQPASPPGSPETQSASYAKTPADWATYWGKELAASKKWMQKWHHVGSVVEREYLAQSRKTEDDTGRFNIFWSNIQVILAAVYTKLPEPEVDRTHKDAQDDVARVAANMLQRIFKFELDDPIESPAEIYKLAIQDRFIPGLGIVWPRYSYKSEDKVTEAINDPATGAELAPKVVETIITEERAPLDYVRWDDFFYSPCRIWSDKRWVARRVYLNEDKLIERFGKVIAKQVPMKTGGAKNLPADDPMRQSPEPVGEVFEIWCSDHGGYAFWYAQGAPVILDAKENPLKISGFFPVAKPLMATHLTNAFLPRPDYTMVQDQYEELHLLASRMKLLTSALKVIGVYNKQAEGVQRMLNQADMNQLIPVDNWAMFAEQGGIKGAVDWLPLDMVVNALEQMTKRKQALLQEIYEILGLSDIMRGQSVATETATAQQLKAQFGSARMQKEQGNVALFLTANTQIRAEIICRHWQPQTIIERSQIMNTPDAQYAQQAVQLLKNIPQTALRLVITADTTAAPDWNQEKQQRIDFLQATSQFIGMSMPMIQQFPGSGPFLIQMLQWAASGFKSGKQIEGVLDAAVAAVQQSLAASKPPPPPSAKDTKDRAQAAESVAKAKGANAETMALLRQYGIPAHVLAQIPPTAADAVPPGQGPGAPPGVQLPPGQGGIGRPPGTALPPPGQMPPGMAPPGQRLQ